jgi:hypothetical protein
MRKSRFTDEQIVGILARAGNTHSTVSLNPDLNWGYPPADGDLAGRIHVVPSGTQGTDGCERHVFVQQKPHYAAPGCTGSIV